MCIRDRYKAMKDSVVNELITAMKDRLPPGQNLANFLTDTLCIGCLLYTSQSDKQVDMLG